MPAGAVQTINGVTYPRTVPSAPGLPAGWISIEQVYGPKSALHGQPYTRYKTSDGRHGGTSSIKKAIELDCKDKGTDPAEGIRAWQDAVKAAKTQRDKETGNVENREEAIAAYQAVYGPLDSPTTAKMPGWSYTVKYLEVSGQTNVTYYNPKGTSFGTLKQIEAHLGCLVLDGKTLDFVNEGKALAKAEWGDYAWGFNPLRRSEDGTTLQVMAASGLKASELNEMVGKKKKRRVDEDDYHENKVLVVRSVTMDNGDKDVAAQLRGAGAASAADLAASCQKAQAWLLQRDFGKDTEILVAFCREPLPLPADMPSAFTAGRLCGIYYQRPGLFQGHRFYQKLQTGTSSLSCSPLFLFWSQGRGNWKLGLLDDAKAGFALHSGEEVPTSQSATPWMLLKDGSCKR